MKKRVLPLLLICLSACVNKPPAATPQVSVSEPPAATPTPSVSPVLPNPPPSAVSVLPEPSQTPDDLREGIQTKYGIEIYWEAETRPFETVAIYPVKDEGLIREFLLLLDGQLNRYPEGFFEESKRRNYVFRFFASDMIISLDSNDFDTYDGYYQDNSAGYADIAINTGKLQDEEWPEAQAPSGRHIEYVLHHEIGHAIAEYTMLYDEGVTFDLSQWYADLMPKDYFYYDMQEPDKREAVSLIEFAAPYLSEEDKGVWFPDSYSQTGFREHLTALFAYAMMPKPPEAWKSPNVQKQAEYFFPLIRKVFETDTWPRETAWEKALPGAL